MMEILNNLGISYKGDYISQGSISDKCKKSTSLNVKNIELMIRNDGKDNDFENIRNLYSGNVIFHLPTININQTNLKNVKDIINELLKYNIKLVTIDASTLLYETFDWSTNEEQQNYLKNMAKAFASIVTSNIEVAIENTKPDKGNLLFGKDVSNISDLLVYTRNALIEEYDYTREKANKMVGISINVGNLIKSDEISSLENWFKIFYNDIKCIKIKDIENRIPLFNQLLDLIISNNIDKPILLETKEEIEAINNAFRKFEHLVKNKIEGKPLNFEGYQNIANSRYNEYNYNFNSAQSGYTNAVIVIIIILTMIAAVLMFMIQMRE